jgi:methionyl-tRNA formyltransferase
MTKIKRVLFFGSKETGLKCLVKIHSLDKNSLIGILTMDDRSDLRSVYTEFQAFSSKAGIPLFTVKNQRGANDVITQLAPELCVGSGWYWIVGSDVLKKVPYGFIGAHHSDLPKYRGGSPLVWAIINGEKFVATTMISLSEKMDEGDVWGKKRVAISPNDYVEDVIKKVEEKDLELWEENYTHILNHTKYPISQKSKGATYCAQRVPSDGMIDWKKDSKAIYNFIRAQSEPYPGAFTFYYDKGARKKLVILRAHPSDQTYYGTPGQVARITPEGIFIICGNSKPLVIELVKVDGDKRKASDAIKSIKTRFFSAVDGQNLQDETL